MLEDLYALQDSEESADGPWVSEAWAVDGGNHGHSAALNDAAFEHLPMGVST